MHTLREINANKVDYMMREAAHLESEANEYAKMGGPVWTRMARSMRKQALALLDAAINLGS